MFIFFSFKASKLQRKVNQGRIRGYGNITQKSKEDLVQIIQDLKEKNNSKDRVIQQLKVRNKKIKQNKYDFAY